MDQKDPKKPAHGHGHGHQTKAPAPTVQTWKSEEPYSLNDTVQPSPANGHVYVCTVAGTSGMDQPIFPTDVGATVTDSTVTWTEKTPS
jgi:hypothetical protein